MQIPSTFPNSLSPATSRFFTVSATYKCGGASVVNIPPKSSADLLDYTFDFSFVLSGTSDVITNVAFISRADEGDYELTAVWGVISGQTVTIFLASGNPGSVVPFAIEITTQQGRVFAAPCTICINRVTDATVAPTYDELADAIKNNGGVAIAVKTLPDGYTSNGGVVNIGDVDLPAGTPEFVSVSAETYSGNGSGLNVVVGDTTQTLTEWLNKFENEGVQGVGVKSIAATQSPVSAGEPSTVTLTTTLTDGSTSETKFQTPEGPQGEPGTPAPQTATIKSMTGAYTFQATDTDCILSSSDSAAVTYTIPTNLPAGTMIGVVQGGSGAVTVAADDGVTLHSVSGGYSTSGQYATVVVTILDGATAILSGSTSI